MKEEFTYNDLTVGLLNSYADVEKAVKIKGYAIKKEFQHDPRSAKEVLCGSWDVDDFDTDSGQIKINFTRWYSGESDHYSLHFYVKDFVEMSPKELAVLWEERVAEDARLKIETDEILEEARKRKQEEFERNTLQKLKEKYDVRP